MDRLADYRAACAAKRPEPQRFGLSRTPELNSTLFPHQLHGVEFALLGGRDALFYDTGLGKTAMMLEWGRCVVEAENKPVLMLAPLAVSQQHIREAERMGIEASISRFGQPPASPRVVVTNYERLERFDPADYAGVILDESSILKSFTGATTRKLISTFAGTRFRLAGSATPAPNDHTELGQHSSFLGVMPSSEMLTRFFIADQANAGAYRLKRAAVRPFWSWVASWARCVSKPSDLGFDDAGYDLPALDIVHHEVKADRMSDPGAEKNDQLRLFRIPDTSATSIHHEKRLTIGARAKLAAQIILGDSCPGSLNTQSVVAPSIILTPLKKSGGKANQGKGKKTAPICGNTTDQTPKNSHDLQSSKLPSTLVAASDMPPTLLTETLVKPSPEPVAPKSAETGGFDLSSGSTALDTMLCLPRKVAGAPSAATSSGASEAKSSQSITATQAAQSGASSASTAITASANSGTILSASEEPLNISKSLDWWVVWCDTDYEQDELEKYIGQHAISIRGSMSAAEKERLHEAWIRGDRKIIISKPSIFGYGLNWQHCNNVLFAGISFSYEAFYQAVRRCWRFGQTRPVQIHVVCADTERAIWAVVERKAGDHDAMKREMVAAMRRSMNAETSRKLYSPEQKATLPAWIAA